MGTQNEPLVSIDYVGLRESAQYDATMTSLIDNTLKVVAWYDNEAGFSQSRRPGFVCRGETLNAFKIYR